MPPPILGQAAGPLEQELSKNRNGAWIMVCVLAFVSGCSPTGGYLTLEGATMGTYYRITGHCALSLAEVRVGIERELERVNAQMSTYLADSELSRFNAADTDEWWPASKELVEVLDAALSISEQTEGAF